MSGSHAIRLVVLCLLSVSSISSRTLIKLSADEVRDKYYTRSKLILSGSDSLFINGELLAPRTDYTFNSRFGYFDLSKIDLKAGDTLELTYFEMPGWLMSSYGEELPEDIPAVNRPAVNPSVSRKSSLVKEPSRVNISGAKSFRVSSQSSGNSVFSQTLDLKLSGYLTDNMEITGAVTDRGYDPAYGTANSRIEELDKINLKIKSPVFSAEIGDLLWYQPGSKTAKRVSGISGKVAKNGKGIEVAAARPKGRFESVRFLGEDGRQGPYQISQSGSAFPVVPGSETVWFDGIPLKKGANNDYTIDYSAGTVTFNVNYPVDRRSRIEIDYEPLLVDFKGELYSAGGDYHFMDSTLALSMRWIREGDSKDELLLDNITEDDRVLLSSIGDSSYLAYKSGIRLDSAGSYVLVADSLPDTVFQYVGSGQGDYSLSFSYVGSDSGDYRYVGGNQYLYAGSGSGDYLAIIEIATPERTDYMMSELTFTNRYSGDIALQLNRSSFDKNLFSDIDDDDNEGLYFRFNQSKKFNLNGSENNLAIQYQKTEFEFKNRHRINISDLNWKYLLPDKYIASGDETVADISMSLTPVKRVMVYPSFSRFSYENSFESRTGGAGIHVRPFSKVLLRSGWHKIESDLDSGMVTRTGDADIYSAGFNYEFNRDESIDLSYENNSREDNYFDQAGGVRFHKVISAYTSRTEKISYEYFSEDSLEGDWRESLTRNRFMVMSSRKFGRVNYNAQITWQKLSRKERIEENLLSRFSFEYRHLPAHLSFGASYMLSDETRNSRGITYLRVEDGRGDYVLEDNNYVPDVNGDYIKLEEILSEKSDVNRSERSFNFSKRWSKAMLRATSNVIEELDQDNNLTAGWLIPFYYDKDGDYFFYSRNYNVDFRILPVKNTHFINIKYNQQQEARTIAEVSRVRDESKVSIAFKESYGESYFEEKLELFKSLRDAYFNGSNGDIDGYRVELSYLQRVSSSQVKLSSSFREATSTLGDYSRQISAGLNTRTDIFKNGEMRTIVELYSQSLNLINASSLYLLSDNRPGEKGAEWTVSLNYRVRKDLRFNLSVSGRHSDNRSARITGRAELIAGF